MVENRTPNLTETRILSVARLLSWPLAHLVRRKPSKSVYGDPECDRQIELSEAPAPLPPLRSRAARIASQLRITSR